VLPIYDGTAIHAEAAVDWILGGEPSAVIRRARPGLAIRRMSRGREFAPEPAARAARAANSSATATGSSIRSRSAACATRPRCSSRPMAITIACG
jgi:hypothetical protein